MILSEDAPDLSGIEEQFGSGEPGETKSYDPLWNGSCQTAFGASG